MNVDIDFLDLCSSLGTGDAANLVTCDRPGDAGVWHSHNCRQGAAESLIVLKILPIATTDS